MNCYYRNLVLGFSVLGIFGIAGCKAKPKPETANPASALEKIEARLGMKLPPKAHRAFFEEVAQWLGTPYQYGGNSQRGTDCSGFVQQVYKKVFNLDVAHQSAVLHQKSRIIRKAELKEGDLYFFKIESASISHVGMHLTDDFFIHASTRSGVVVSRLQEPYYQKTFADFGTYR